MESIADQLVKVFEGFRMEPSPIDQYDTIGKTILKERIATMVATNQPLQFVMLGFPFKSVNNRDKVLGALPDFGERATIDNFAHFNNLIQAIYPQGMKLNMVSDGFVFNDVLEVEDRTVDEYKEISMSMSQGVPIEWLDVRSFYQGGSMASKRNRIVEHFGITPEKLEQDILMNPDVNFLYRGMIRFMEEELAIKSFPSRNQLQKAAKIVARQMMFRNEAYSNLVRSQFKSSIRLSMHPSVNNGAKYSFKLINSPYYKHSAWHSAVLVRKDGLLETIHKKDAMVANYTVVYKDIQPYYFIEH